MMDMMREKILLDPLTIALGFGALAGGVQSLQQGSEQQDALQQEAKATREAAQFNETIRKMQTRKAIGRQIAQAGQGAFSGSNLEVITKSVIENDLQGQIDLFNAEVGARRFENKGKMAKQQGRRGFFNSLLQGGTAVFKASQLNPTTPKLNPKFNDIRVSGNDFAGELGNG